MNMTISFNGLSSKTLIRAAALKKRIEKITKDLEHILGGTGTWTTSKAKTATTAEPKMRRKRRMSKAARAKQAARMRKKWAKVKAAGKNAL
jgi:hypothetical protein